MASEYAVWLGERFPHVADKPLGRRHRRLWEWFSGLRAGERPRARIEVWPRGGAKSSTAELGCAFVGTKLTRRFVLYVSGTQDQADLHVQAIASLFEQIGVERALSKYGTSKGWRRNQLRTKEGFNVAAYGLDGATRGIKIEKYRPDLIIFDDIDSQSDSTAAVEKKIAAITRAIIPTGASDCAILFLQNLIHEGGVVSRLVDGRAEFLLDREPPMVEPAVIGLATEIVELPDGRRVHRIMAGEASWEGQPLSVCERQINDWGLRAFLREAQHEVKGAEGYFFDSSKFVVVDDAPNLIAVCLAWDLAATEGAGDYTVAVLSGLCANGLVWVLQVTRGQLASDKVRRLIRRNAELVHGRFPRYSIHIPQDPGQAGKDQADQLRRLLASFRGVRIETMTGSKAVRARGWAEKVNLGNVRLLRGHWNQEFIEEHRKFREDETHDFDDQVDAAADAFNELAPPGTVSVSRRIVTSGTYLRDHPESGGSRPWFEEGSEEDDEEED
ncbi:MAG TPA: phage terminase large subunit [Fimbriimonadaceae bacterium]|nr:phage terminase large subunit [Fimbriimonadaceae bacterium]